MNTTEYYQWAITENGVREGGQPLYDVVILNTKTGQKLKIEQIVWFVDRFDYLEEIFNRAVSTLNGTPDCCYTGKVSWQ